jgi:hypothetical protein
MVCFVWPSDKSEYLTGSRRFLNRFLKKGGPFTDPDAVLGTPLQERLSAMKVL